MNTPQSEAISHEAMTQFFKTLVVDDGRQGEDDSQAEGREEQ
jgi:hypothetical protein